ncbi:MAG TPA: hypothetical protein VE913_19535, partial [Longimicrobium sp.]|nr:hypothetical protein [Longimicrobium sp.]
TSPCPTRSCVELPGGGRACTCADPTDVDSVRVERPGQPTLEWTAPGGGRAAATGWEVALVPVEAGRPRTVVMAQRTGISNGLGVSYWRLWITPPGAGAPRVVDVREYGFGGSWVRPARGGECRLFATRWTSGREPGRVAGRYLQGRWLELRGGVPRPAPDRPTVERRYLLSFERARGETAGAPFAWFRHPGARVETLPRTPVM